jgi:hypothetical protein
MELWEKLKQIGANVNVDAGLHVFVGRKAGRYIGEFLDGVGKDNILVCMQNGKWLTDYLSPEKKSELIQQAVQFRSALDAFPDEEVYSWIPQDKCIFFEGIEGGPEYLMGQIAEIRRILKSAQLQPELPNQVKAHRIR